MRTASNSPRVGSSRPAWAGLSWAVAAAIFTQGCGGAVQPQCHVTGKVLYQGQPAANVCVRLHLSTNTQQALKPVVAWSNPDGSFELKVASPGAYHLTALWPAVEVVEGESIEGPDQLNGRWNNVLAPALTKTIDAGENAIPPIELAQVHDAPPSSPVDNASND